MQTYLEVFKRSGEILKNHLHYRFADEASERHAVFQTSVPSILRIRDSVGFDIFVEEDMWFRAGRPTIIVEDIELAQMVFQANFDVDASTVTPPNNALVQFAFRKPFHIGGYPVAGLLYGRLNIAERFSNVERIGKLIGQNFVLAPGGMVEGWVCIFSHGKDQPHLRAFLTPDMIQEVLDDPAWFLDHYQGDARMGITEDGAIHLSKLWAMTLDDAKRQATMLRLSCGLCAYMKAFPQSVVVSKDKKTLKLLDVDKFKMSKQKIFCLSLQSEHKTPHGSPTAHWRRWHFRTLRDARYKRNSDGSFRVVFVRDSVVNPESRTPASGKKVKSQKGAEAPQKEGTE